MLLDTDAACRLDPAQAPCAVETSERAREREIAAYLSAASFPPDLPSGPLPEPLLNADPTLNALVQLGAHRLNCDRAFLSLIDRKYQFVVAEITRSHSLVEKRSAPNEHIFLGVTKLDACWGVCPTTMKAFLDETGEWVRTGPNVIANRTRYIINDFTTEPGYTERPYVLNYPYFRSYLEVPLVSPLGYLLGSYCVVHNDLKHYDDEATVEIMNEIAAAIMDHLELRRIQQSRGRSEQLIQGLSGFINDESPVPEQSPPTSTPNPARTLESVISPAAEERPDSNWPEVPPDTELSEYPRPPLNQGASSSSQESAGSLSTPLGQVSSETPPTTPREELDEDPFAQLVTTGNSAGIAGDVEDVPSSPSDTTELHANGFISSANVKSTLYRAAVTIRKSMNMDGFMFLDAVPSSFADRSDQLAVDDETDVAREEVVGPFCAAIVQSHAEQAAERLSPSSETRLPEVALQRLIRRFPHGHIFSADEFGPIDEIYAPGRPWPTGAQSDEDRILRHDISTLFRVLPRATYIVFRPLWHFQQECWYAAAVGWVAEPMRAFDLGDINLVTAFGNSVMAEVSRMEALATSRAKSDFVSSISHELRSPLHGIMAGSELLREGISHNPMLVSTLDMLDSCGTTLLDIFNNLLEHAIVTSSGGRYQSTMANVRITDLGGLIEDVLDVVHISHLSENAFQTSNHRKGSFAVESSTNASKPDGYRPLLVTLDIGKRASWKLPVNTGAWKRIVMNLFANALKYTKSGRIQVTLKEVQRPDKSGNPCDYISFSVQDTGRGMSSDYLKYKLFMPFTQESTLNPGMGLGLSIVQQLASGLGGTVDVKSSVGVGTLVEVLVPLEDSFDDIKSLPAAVEHDKPAYDKQRHFLKGRTVCLITPEAYNAMAAPDLQVSNSTQRRSATVEKALKANAGVTLGMDVIVATAECPNPAADVYVIDTNLLSAVPLEAISVLPAKYPAITPLVLLCAGAGPPSCSKQDALKRHSFHLHHPLGPRKLASILCSAIEAASQPQPQLTSPNEPSPPVISTPELASFLPPTTLPTHPKPEAPSTTAEPQSVSLLSRPLTSSHTTTTCLPPQPAASQQSYHLLLVDDNPINVKLLATCMTRLHHTFSTACNGLEAVQLFRDSLSGKTRPFDMVFMDISMPVMDGFEATREIRRLEAEAMADKEDGDGDRGKGPGRDDGGERGGTGGRRGVRIVALTGLSSEESRDEALASGSDVFLTKPVKLDKVKRVIGGLLGDGVAEEEVMDETKVQEHRR